MARSSNGRTAIGRRLRLGAFQVTRHQGGDQLNERVGRAWQILGELDRFWQIGRNPGALRLLVGASRTRSVRYDKLLQALQAGTTPIRSGCAPPGPRPCSR